RSRRLRAGPIPRSCAGVHDRDIAAVGPRCLRAAPSIIRWTLGIAPFDSQPSSPKPNHQEDDVNSIYKVGLWSLALGGMSLAPAPAQIGSQAERPYSVAQALGMPGALCSNRGMQVCLGGMYRMVCQCAPNAISGCRWAHTGLRCR